MDTTNWETLLESAVNDPGTLSEAYRAFHTYSLGNQIAAMFQCAARELPMGPLATFPGWLAKGRHVKKGEKALTLCQPVTCKGKATVVGDDDPTFTRFVFKPKWFTLAQTEGDALPVEPIPTWDAARALETLAITEVPFSLADGNCQGYACERMIAVSPVAAWPHKTRFHELAHIVLGHTAEATTLSDDPMTPRDLRECEAETVAMLLCASLGLEGMADARGYIQHWYGHGHTIPAKNAQRILKAANQILQAGTVQS